MSLGSEIDDQIWHSIVPDLVLNTDSAIYKFWRQMRNDPSHPNPGPPIGPETQMSNGVQQAFSSGLVIGWNETDGAYLADG